MRRVSSRQRLVSWDAFDATARGANSEDDSFETCYEQESLPPSRSPSAGSLHDEDTTLKRKRTIRHKQEPSAQSVVSDTESSDSSASENGIQTTAAAAAMTVPAYDWEIQAFNNSSSIAALFARKLHTPSSLTSLNDDVQLKILEFCDTGAVRNMMQVNHRYRNLITSEQAKALWREVCHRQWPWLVADDSIVLVDSLHLPTAALDQKTTTEMANLALLLSLAAEHKSTRIDESIFAPCRWSRTLGRFRTIGGSAVQLKCVTLSTSWSNQATAVQYIGNVGRGDRCIRADQPLPRPLLHTSQFACRKHRSLLQRFARLHKHHKQEKASIWRPFVAPFVGGQPNQVHLTPRLISYFEVDILAKPNESDEDNGRFRLHDEPPPHSRQECVAVGLATQEFSLHTRMPGWDKCSFGYHGDDGGVFHAHGHMVRQYGPQFGVGDTVGCGIDYVTSSIFFTINGRYLGPAWQNLPVSVLNQDFYPTVGMDTNCPVACNFGCDRPFRFDLNAMICEQGPAILQSMAK